MNKNTPRIEVGDEVTRRMEWRCRRGMLELDLLLSRFVKAFLPHLNYLQMEALNELLELPDNVLWKLITGPDYDKNKPNGQLLKMLRGLAVN